MNYFVSIYLILYISYVIFGPHFISKLIKNDDIEIVNNFEELYKRIFYLSYLSYLFSALFFYKPNINTFFLAILINLFAFIGFIIKFYNLRFTDPYYWTGIISHFIVIIPLIYGKFYYKINFKNSNFNTLIILIFFIFLLIFYYTNHKFIYKISQSKKDLNLFNNLLKNEDSFSLYSEDGVVGGVLG